VHIKTIVTHEYPDLDAIMSIWLLRRYGNDLFPGVATAKLEFLPAQRFYGKGDEITDTIVVDIEGGHFDHHGPEKSTKCSAMLIAEYLSLGKKTSLAKMIRYVNLVDTTGKASSTIPDPLLLLFSIGEMIKGWHSLNGSDFVRTVNLVCQCLDAINETERLWLSAKSDSENAIVVQGGSIKVIGLSSDSTSAMKVGRSLYADVVVVKDSNGHVGITATSGIKWKEPDLTPTIRMLRLVESSLSSNHYSIDQLSEVGDLLGWFFHSSRVIISCGGPKARNRQPTLMTLSEICSLVAISLNVQTPWPERLLKEKRSWEQIVTLAR